MPDGSNAFQITRAVRVNTPAFIALAGPSGSGKTRSALELATGLAGPSGKILIADTEGNRALHYADLYTFDHVEWQPPFTPERNAALIDLAESRGYSVLVIDSESDEWEGEGGLQEIRESTKDEFWARTKARHKHALINRIRRSKVHIVFCLRAEERVRISKVDGRTMVEPLGWQPICEKRFMHEVQSSFIFDPANPGVPIPVKLYDIHAQFFPKGQKVSRSAGEALAQWCSGGVPAPQRPQGDDVMAEAYNKVTEGEAKFRAWYRSLTPERQSTLKAAPVLWLDLAKDADRQRASNASLDEEAASGEPPAPAEPLAPRHDALAEPQPEADAEPARDPALF